MKMEMPLRYLTGVGPKMGERLQKLGLKTVADLLEHYPFRYEDFSLVRPIAGLRIGEEAVIKAEILEIKNEQTRRRFMSLTRALVGDKSGEMEVAWFNQPFLVRNFSVGSTWIFKGKVNFDRARKTKILLSPIAVKNPEILPVYSETRGVTSAYLRRIIRPLLSPISELKDFLPFEIIREQKLVMISEALKNVHFPSDFNAMEKSRRRLAFDELFLLSLKMLALKKELQKEKAAALVVDRELLKEFTASLPYKLTIAQKKSAWEIIQDLAKPFPMNRLLEGEVGSGKTVVGAMAVLVAAKNNYQSAWLAPTEILAQQHYNNVSKLLEKFDVRVGLLTSSQAKISDLKSKILNLKSEILNLKSEITSQCDLVIGTHALLQKDIHFKNLGLVIVDEQHRFGVTQRGALRDRVTDIGYRETKSVIHNPISLTPHFLSMTATPIPRSLALALYGDLDLSIIDELPIGRQKIETRIVKASERDKAYEFIRQHLKAGRQAFVITPLIQKKETVIPGLTGNLKIPAFAGMTGRVAEMTLGFDNDNRKAAVEERERLAKNIFPEFRVGLLHGKMRPKEKEKTMKDFAENKIQILVSTSVVEVGIDIQNATIMLIEGAERFGLAQLHQFRGRVGRGSFRSFCFLFASDNKVERARLTAMTEAKNGFELAQKDLEIRGPGQLAGVIQSGLPDLKMASLSDIILIKKARAAAENILQNGIEKYPALISKMKEFGESRHLE